MRMIVSAVLSVVVSLLVFGTTPALATDIGAGAQVFTTNCAACHMRGGNAIMGNKTLKQDALEQYLGGYGTEHDVAAIVYQVTNGKNAMPAFSGRLTDEQIADVASYVKDQSEKGW